MKNSGDKIQNLMLDSVNNFKLFKARFYLRSDLMSTSFLQRSSWTDSILDGRSVKSIPVYNATVTKGYNLKGFGCKNYTRGYF